jgi:hypothetical protein
LLREVLQVAEKSRKLRFEEMGHQCRHEGFP